MDCLDEAQNRVADQTLQEEGAARHHLVVALSGSHAYGFPSPDSDLDIKAIHVAATADLVGLAEPRETTNRLEVVNGVEIDYTSNEIGPVLRSILAGNGNYIERVLGALIMHTTPDHESLKPLVQASISRRVHRHYRGFAAQQRKAFETDEQPTAKRLLYALRTALTGVHLLRTGELRVDLSAIAGDYGYGEALELIETKRAGERTVLAPGAREQWRDSIERAFRLLEESYESSPLPEEPANAAEIDAWLVDLRRRHFE